MLRAVDLVNARRRITYVKFTVNDEIRDTKSKTVVVDFKVLTATEIY
jgi:hypothetical protein